MKKSIWKVLVTLSLLIALLPIRVSAASDEFQMDGTGTIVLGSSHAALEGVSSLQFSLRVESTKAETVSFNFNESLSADVKEYRYHADSGQLNIYLAGSEALFGRDDDFLTIGSVLVVDGKGEGAPAKVSIVPKSLYYVYGEELRLIGGVSIPDAVQLNGYVEEEEPTETPPPLETATPEPSASPEPTATPAPTQTPDPVGTPSPSPTPGVMPTPGADKDGDLTVVDGKYYFYEDGVMAASKEAYVNGAWRWFDADGTMAVDKDVYQTSSGGKWVRYNDKGEMIKGEDYRYGGWYYFEPITGTMMKGAVTLEDGRKVFYDTVTGQMLKGEHTIAGQYYKFDETDGHLLSGQENNFWVNIDGRDYWCENWQRQGWNPGDDSYRGKEIYDPASDGWYWLDNVQQGAKAVSKDVYQESMSAYPDRPDGTGKWVRYDAQGRMVKGWHMTDAGSYYFEPITGAMAKGTVTIDGKTYHFDEVTGVRDMVKGRNVSQKN